MFIGTGLVVAPTHTVDRLTTPSLQPAFQLISTPIGRRAVRVASAEGLVIVPLDKIARIVPPNSLNWQNPRQGQIILDDGTILAVNMDEAAEGWLRLLEWAEVQPPPY